MVTTILYTTFITLVGLQLCCLNREESRLASISPLEKLWCPSPSLRLLYGLTQLLGVAFVLFGAGLLTFTIHWWYFILYIALAILADVASIIVFIPFGFIDIPTFMNHYMYGELRFRRLIGSILIFIGIGIFFLA